MLFSPGDADAHAALHAALLDAAFDVVAYGPLLMVRDVHNQLVELGAALKLRLSRYTLCCIQGVCIPAGLQSVEQIFSAMAFTKPVLEMLENIEHEWVRGALKEGWLFSVFHPIVGAGDAAVYGYEALLRARNPLDAQVIGAGKIINACEKLELTHQLDQRARQTAIRAAAHHVQGDSRIFINFLPNTIYDPEICLRTTMEAAQANNVSMDRLIFEVVETEKIPDMDHLCKILSYYRERGVGTAIDDMGAGFTGTDYITSLQPDFVKLDREFVLNAQASDQGRAAMDMMISASHRSNARVIAEGIETPEQITMCQNAGVDFLQGFLFAKPACPPQPVQIPTVGRKAA